MNAITTCQPAWLEDIQQSYVHNPQAVKLLDMLNQGPDAKKRFSLRNGIIYFRDKVWLGGTPPMQQQIMQAFHASTTGGHSGFPVTYSKIRGLFAWPKMKKQIKTFVQTCLICQQAKPERVKYPGLLQPLPTPDEAWKMVTMDFIEGLPTSGSANSIMVVVDKFTHYAHFIPLHHPFTAAKVAAAYLDNVFKLHSLPEVMISDRDPIFASKFWQELFSLTGCDLRMSSAYHPQTDGQSERVNQCLEIYLRCFTHATPHKWSQYLSLAEFWYNTSYHSAIRMSPFVALYGKEPRQWGITPQATCTAPLLDDWLKERKQMQELLQHNLNHAKQQMKKQADKSRTPRTFKPGEEVFIKLQPYVQSSVARRANHKLAFKYFGPYSIIREINPVAYEVELPPDARIHPIFHVSQLRKVLRPGTQASSVPPVITDVPATPVKIIAQRWRRGSNGRRAQVQVQWSDPAAGDITWEDEQDLRRRFPEALAWGQASCQGEGDVSTPNTSSDDMGLVPKCTRPTRMIQPNRSYMGPDWTK